MRLEVRDTTSLALNIGLPIVALVFAAAFCAVLVMFSGASPFQVFGLMITGAFGTQFAFLETLTRATPLIFTGLAAAVAFRAKLWNIGAESQLYLGAVMTVALGTGLLPLPSVILWPVLMMAAVMGGALALSVPTFLKTRFGVDEVVTTLLLNFVVLLLVSLLLDGLLKDAGGLGWPQSKKVIADAQLPKLIKGKRLHLGFLFALGIAAVIWFIDRKTVLGFEMRAVGHNPKAAQFAGINVSAVLAKTAIISGGLAGLAGWSEVTGLKGNLTLDLSPGFGYTGIVVAMLAMLHPLGVVLSAIFVAAVFVGADAMSRTAGVPSYIAQVMVAVALLSMVTALMLTRYRIRFA
jgi:general nucleoside transport system permease protein